VREVAGSLQLAELLAHHGISAGARDEIEQHINWYRSGSSRRGQGPRIDIPPEFEQMRGAAVALANCIRRVEVTAELPDHIKQALGVDLTDPIKQVGVDGIVAVFLKTLLIDNELRVMPDDQAFRDHLEQLLANLDDFANRLTAAQRHGGHRGRKTDRARHFVKIVASVIERDKGQRIKRSENKDSLYELLKGIAVVMDIGPGTVEEVVRARQERLRRGEISRGKR
jgi:hypothetical protein